MNRAARRAYAAKRRSHIRASARAGFTLIELAVSLVAGLIVSMAVMGVSREATSTFHEEVRVAGAEMALRIAMERMRLDLQRAAFMSSGNLVGDPLIATMSNYMGSTPNLSNFSATAAIPYSLLNLSGIAIHPQGASVLNDHNIGDPRVLNPSLDLAFDSIDIGGNFSSSDEYAVKVLWGPQPGVGACLGVAAGAAALSLQMATPAGWRIRNAEAAAALSPTYVAGVALEAAFHPGSNPASQFLLRVGDQTGHYQYLLGVKGGIGATTCYDVASATAIVYVSSNSSILQSTQTGGGGVTGFGVGTTTVNPVDVVRWDIMSPGQFATAVAAVPATATAYQYGQTAVGNGDPTDFLLTRSYLDFSAACTTAAPCPIDPWTTEVVAEYAVDLSFGFTYDSYQNPACTGLPCPTAAPTYVTNPLLNIPMNTQSAGTPSPYSAQTALVYRPNIGPQRIRDVQVRLGMRSPFGDRPTSIASTTTSPSIGYMYRYQLDPGTVPGTGALHYSGATPFARVRESTTEVTLPNQARFYW